MKKQKIILDTNLWISFLISNKLTIIEKLVETKNIKILYSENLINELIYVVKRPKFKKYFSEESVSLLLDYFKEECVFISVFSNLKVCRDEKDNFLLNLSIDGNADYLITGDSDLLVLNQIENTKIITINDFIKLTNKN